MPSHSPARWPGSVRVAEQHTCEMGKPRLLAALLATGSEGQSQGGESRALSAGPVPAATDTAGASGPFLITTASMQRTQRDPRGLVRVLEVMGAMLCVRDVPSFAPRASGHLLPRALSFSAVQERSPCFLEFSATAEPGSVDPRPLWSLMPQMCLLGTGLSPSPRAHS